MEKLEIASDSEANNTYICRTKIGGALCETVVAVGDYSHQHGCPMEEDMCGARECNESGACQA